MLNPGVGRYRNESYGEFLKALNSANRLTKRIGPREVSMMSSVVVHELSTFAP